MTAPDRIIADCGFVPAENAVATFASWDKLTEYVRADLARTTPLAEALAVISAKLEEEHRLHIMALGRDPDKYSSQFSLALDKLKSALRAIGEGRADTKISADAEIGRGTASRITKGDVSPTSD